jgi:putative transport protein
MFLTVSIGLALGKIKFGVFSFGSSGALFFGIFVGWLIYGYALDVYTSSDSGAAFSAAVSIFEENGGKLINKSFFLTSLIFFVAAVGLLASKDLGIVLRKYGGKFIALGIIITFVGAASTYAATGLLNNANPYSISGVYTGALTSSPGLASALETAETQSTYNAKNFSDLNENTKNTIIDVINLTEKDKVSYDIDELTQKQKTTYITNATGQVGMGYAVGYPFGVIIVILGVNFLGRMFGFDIESEKHKYIEEMAKARDISTVKRIPTTPFSTISFAIVCVLGYLLGNFKVFMGPLGYVSLESTGGVLITALLLGYIGKIGPLSFRMNESTLSTIRELSLSFFLAIVGLNYGYGAITSLTGSGLTLALTSIGVGIISIMIGFLVGRYIFHLNWVMLAGALCGGMTSTPGLGAATDALDSEDPAAGYGATYPFALFGMIIFTIILHKLPML